jgi:hypothetical protein
MPVQQVEEFINGLTAQQQAQIFPEVASGATPQQARAKEVILAKSVAGRSGGNSV